MKRYTPIFVGLFLSLALTTLVWAFSTQWSTHWDGGNSDLGQWSEYLVGACGGQDHSVSGSSVVMRADDDTECFGAYYRDNSTRPTFPTDQDVRVIWRWRYPEWGWFGTQAGQVTGRYGWPQYYGVSAVDSSVANYAHVEANGPWGKWDVDSPIWHSGTRNTSWHTSVFDFLCDGQTLNWYIDGSQILSRAGSALPAGHPDRPYQFWFGNLMEDVGPSGSHNDWTGFDIDYIYVYAVERPQMNTPGAGSGGAQPVSWNPVPNTQQPDSSTWNIEYQARACTTSSCSSVVATSAWQPGTDYTFTGLQPNTTYYFQVRARWVGTPELDTCWSTAVPATMPGAPAISLAKSATSIARPGDPVQYTLVVQNTGTGQATGVVVRDPVPQYIVNPTNISGGGAVLGSDIVWNIGTLNAGQSQTLTWRGTVDPAIPAGVTEITNVATATDDAGHADQAEATTSIVMPAISLAKSATTVARPGDPVQYTLVVQNTGTGQATGVVVRDTIPQYIINPTNISGGGSVQGNEVVWNIGALNAGQSQTLTWRGTVDPATPAGVTEITNVATATDDAGHTDQAEATTDIVVPAIFLDKMATDEAGPGKLVQYTLVVQNTGTGQATGVVVRDPIPQYIINPTNISGGGSVQGSEVVWNIGTLNAGGSLALTWRGTVDPAIPLSVTKITNVATATDDAGHTDQAEATTSVGQPAMAVAKLATSPVMPGQAIDYQVVITNTGNTLLPAVHVEDPLPPYVTPVPHSISDGGYETPDRIVWDSIGDMMPGEVRIVTWQGLVDVRIPTSQTQVLNQATVTTGPLTGHAEAVSDLLRPVLAIEKVAGATAYAGGEIDYTLRLTNTGTGAAHFIVVSDPVPTYTWYVPDVAPTTVAYGVLEGDTVVWRLNELAAGQSTELRWRAQVDVDVPPAIETIYNLAQATAVDIPDPITATATTQLLDPGLILNKTCLSFAQAGDVLPYQVHVENGGTGTVRDAVVREPLAEGLSYVPGSATLGGQLVGSEIVWELGTIAPGDAVDLEFALQAAPDLTDAISTTTRLVSADQALAQRGCQTALIAPALAITKIAPAQALSNDVVEYTIVVTNTTPVIAYHAVLTDTLPSGADYVPGSASDGGEVSDTAIVWQLGDLAVGQTVVRTFQAQVHAPQGVDDAQIYNEAVAAADRAVPVRASATTLVPRPVLNLAKSAPAETTPGGVITYTLSGGNSGPGVARQAVLEDRVPDDLIVLENTIGDGGYYVAERNAVAWPLGDLAAGAAVERSFAVLVPLTLRPGSRTLDNVAFIASPDAAPASAQATTVITGDSTVVGLKRATAYSEPGGEIDYTLQVYNGSSIVAADVVVRDPLPEYTTYITGSASLPPAFADDGRTLEWTIGTMAPGETYEIRFTVQVDGQVPDYLDRIVDVATVSYSGGSFEIRAVTDLPGVHIAAVTPTPTRKPTSTPSSSSPAAPTATSRPPSQVVSIPTVPPPSAQPPFGTSTPAPTPPPGPRLTKSVSPSAVETGRTTPVTWTLVFTNPTPLMLGGVTVRDPLPAGLVYVGSSASQGAIEVGGDLTRTVVNARLGDVPGGGRAEILISTQVLSGTPAGTVYTNSATYSAVNADPGASNQATVVVKGATILPVTGGLLDPRTPEGKVVWSGGGLLLLAAAVAAWRGRRYLWK